MKNKKRLNAQVTTQVFMFILAVIVLGVIILYGYEAITKFLSTSVDVAIADFQNQFMSSVESIKRDYGSVSKLELTLPKKFTQICVVDSDTTKNIGDFSTTHERMYSSWVKSGENIFLIPTQAQPIKINDIIVQENNGYFCQLNSLGKITLRLEGQGDKALVSPWPQ